MSKLSIIHSLPKNKIEQLKALYPPQADFERNIEIATRYLDGLQYPKKDPRRYTILQLAIAYKMQPSRIHSIIETFQKKLNQLIKESK